MLYLLVILLCVVKNTKQIPKKNTKGEVEQIEVLPELRFSFHQRLIGDSNLFLSVLK